MNNNLKKSDIALQWNKKMFGGESAAEHPAPQADKDNFDINTALSSITSSNEVPPQNHLSSHDLVPFTFSEAGWRGLQQIGASIGTADPSQIIRRALAVLWLVSPLGDCSIKNNITGKTVRIPE